MKPVLLAAAIVVASPALAQSPGPAAPDRNAIMLQTLQAQTAALQGANQICQIDAADLKKQLDAALEKQKQLEAELAAQKPAPAH